jgi:hypothetical protein
MLNLYRTRLRIALKSSSYIAIEAHFRVYTIAQAYDALLTDYKDDIATILSHSPVHSVEVEELV